MKVRHNQGIGLTSLSQRRRLTSRLVAHGISNDTVLHAIESVPRHLFIDDSIAHLAYEDMALPIGQRQTISQPYVVALMSQAVLDVPNVQKVLEIGTGSGYQAAILAHLVPHVYSVERIQTLFLEARTRLRSLKLNNIKLKHSDGQHGWSEHAPYDVIIVTAATRQVPPELEAQLGENGRIILPRGDADRQQLFAIDRVNGGWKETCIESVVFVPLLAGTVES